jgi:hypothetical protein
MSGCVRTLKKQKVFLCTFLYIKNWWYIYKQKKYIYIYIFFFINFIKKIKKNLIVRPFIWTVTREG